MTRRLFFDDAERLDFDAQVLALESAGDGCRVVLDQTAFYATAGGQPHDTGTLGDARVLEVLEEAADRIVHRLERAPTGAAVGATLAGRVDRARRRDHMEQHSGQHVLSAACAEACRAETLSFHLGAELSSIDLDRPGLSPDKLAAAEELANRIVRECRLVRPTFHTPAEAARLPLRKPPAVAGPIRVITVDGFDVSACGGTHVRSTGEIGQIRVVGAEKTKGMTRVEFVCGGRALAWARRQGATLDALRGTLGTSEAELGAALARLLAEQEGARKERKELAGALADYQAAELLAAAPVLAGGVRLVATVLDGRGMKELSGLAERIRKAGRAVALLGGRGEQPALVLARAEGIDLDLRTLLAQVLPLIAGKGGGRPEFVQAGGTRLDGLAAAIEAARASVAGLLAAAK